MDSINLFQRTKSLIVTPISNISFTEKMVIDQTLMDEIKIGINGVVEVFNLTTQSLESIHIKELKDHHWYFKNDELFKIMHIITNDYEKI